MTDVGWLARPQRHSDGEQEVPAAVAGEDAAGAVPAVRGRGQAEDQHARALVAPAGHRAAPVALAGERPAPGHGDLLAPGHQPRAGPAHRLPRGQLGQRAGAGGQLRAPAGSAATGVAPWPGPGPAGARRYRAAATPRRPAARRRADRVIGRDRTRRCRPGCRARWPPRSAKPSRVTIRSRTRAPGADDVDPAGVHRRRSRPAARGSGRAAAAVTSCTCSARIRAWWMRPAS